MGAVVPAQADDSARTERTQAVAGHTWSDPPAPTAPTATVQNPTAAGWGGNARVCAGITFSDRAYYCGDPRLGPRYLPTRGVLGAILADYRRLGGQTANGFIQTWWLPLQGRYDFPPKNGFRLDSAGNPISVPLSLRVGQKLDRFGGEGGQFLAPAGTPYSQRSLPPQSLNTIEGDYPFNYHVYKVLKPFPVDAGPAAPWFNQPGEGIQYKIPGNVDNVGTLVSGGFLQRLN
jgi:hypothetical protein